jgi:hypothetical protein
MPVVHDCSCGPVFGCPTRCRCCGPAFSWHEQYLVSDSCSPRFHCAGTTRRGASQTHEHTMCRKCTGNPCLDCWRDDGMVAGAPSRALC